MDAFIEHMSEQHADDKIQCVICQEICDSGLEYSMHYIYNHTEQGSKQVISSSLFMSLQYPLDWLHTLHPCYHSTSLE